MCALAAVLVGLIALFTQLGPSLVSYAINHGLTPPHYDYGVVVLMAVLYLVSIVVSGGAQWGQARVTGRLASWVMNDLRIKVFRHLQRLSLDFFTEEKAGVVMSRMTSDIENLQQLLQDGLAQFAIQGLTMVGHHRLPVRHEREAGRHHGLLRAASARHHVDLVQAGLRARLRQGARRHRARAGRPLREPAGRPHRHGTQPSALQRRDTPRHRRLLPRRQQLHGANQRHLRTGVTGHQRLRPAAHSGHRRHHVPAPPPRDQPGAADRVLPLREPVLLPDSVAGAAVQHVPAGPGLGVQAAGPARNRALGAGGDRRGGAAQNQGRRSTSTTSPSATTRRSRCCTTST